jgi:hypothetical protein
MNNNKTLIALLGFAVVVGACLGFWIKSCLEYCRTLPPSAKQESVLPPVSKQSAFEALDVSGELLAEISPFELGVSNAYVEIRIKNVTKDRQVHIRYIKVAFFDKKRLLLDYGEAEVSNKLKPGEVTTTFVYMNKRKSASFYNERAETVRFDRIGESLPFKPPLRDL